MGEGPRAFGAVPGMVPGTACGTPALGSWNCCPLQVEVPKTKTTSSQIFTMLASHCCWLQPQKIAKKVRQSQVVGGFARPRQSRRVIRHERREAHVHLYTLGKICCWCVHTDHQLTGAEGSSMYTCTPAQLCCVPSNCGHVQCTTIHFEIDNII